MNNENNYVEVDQISSIGKVSIYVVLVSIISIFLLKTTFLYDYIFTSLKYASEFRDVLVWDIVLIISIFSLILYFVDNKSAITKSMYLGFVVAGALHIFLNALLFTIIIYLIECIIATKKNYQLNNNSSNKTLKFIVYGVVLLVILFTLYFVFTNIV